MIRPAWLRETDSRFARNPPREPNLEIQKLARQYCEHAGLPPIQPTPRAEPDPKVAREIAIIFDRTSDQSRDPNVQVAYGTLVDEIDAQFEVLARVVDLVPYGDDEPPPYRDSADMMAQLHRDHALFVYSGGAEHSILTQEQNWRFRAIHDLFGHAAGGFSFGPIGEHLAWMGHCKLFLPLARCALTTETRAQNFWVNFGPYSHLPVERRPYAEQKSLLLPVHYRTDQHLIRAYRDFPGFIEEPGMFQVFDF